MIVRILKVHFFGINMVAWYICNIAEVALALLFFYIFAREMKTPADEIKLFATGEYGDLITPLCKNKFEYDGDLTLNGLCRIYNKSKENKA